ncbi:MAG TPA: hypothetical protein VHJ17_15580 [Thermomonospora sp.]|nr:hypothetical protein [Thermomonospora sp.]
MTEKSGVFENQPITTEVELARLFQGFQLDGVRGNPTEAACKVVPGGGLNIKVSPGYAHVAGYWYESSGDGETRQVAPGGSQPRVDLVLLRADPAANTVTAVVRPGTPSAAPTPPALVRTPGGAWELPLAHVRVAANATTIGVGEITDAREFAGTTVAPSYSFNRPDRPSMGQLIYEHDTARWVGNTGGLNWRVVAEDSGWVDLPVAWPSVWKMGIPLKARRINGVVHITGALDRIGTLSSSDQDGSLLTVLQRPDLRPALTHSAAIVADFPVRAGRLNPARLFVDPGTGEVWVRHNMFDITDGQRVFVSTSWVAR